MNEIEKLTDREPTLFEIFSDRHETRAERPSGKVREGNSLNNCFDCLRSDCSGCLGEVRL